MSIYVEKELLLLSGQHEATTLKIEQNENVSLCSTLVLSRRQTYYIIATH
tara:strand:- start:142 stop:291 length:150 start_codon:yes stop_codon:yes gene_type:complete